MYCSEICNFADGDSLYEFDPNLLHLSKLSRYVKNPKTFQFIVVGPKCQSI